MNSFELRIMACPSVSTTIYDTLGIPDDDRPIITDLYHEENCEGCQQSIWVGPRQAISREVSTIKVLTLCFVCAVYLQSRIGDDTTEIRDLGGGFEVEGEPLAQVDEQETPYFMVGPEDLPFTIEIFREETGNVLWRQEVAEAGVVSIPGFGNDGPVGLRVFAANGEVRTHYSDGFSEIAREEAS